MPNKKKAPAPTRLRTTARGMRRRVTGRSKIGMIVDGVQMWRETIYYSDGTQEIVNEGARRV